MSADAYQQLWHIVAGAVEDALGSHPDYLTPKGRRSARASIIKRVTGTVHGFALQAKGRGGSAAATQRLCKVELRSGGAFIRHRKNSGAHDGQENGGPPEDARRNECVMSKVASAGTEDNAKGSILSFNQNSPDHEAAIWLDSLVARSLRGIVTEVTELTPPLARVLLNRNPNNRNLNANIASRYARDIQSGNWSLNGEPIIVSRDGLLNDGQHRCQAVVESETAIPVVVVAGVQRSTRETLDQGAVRTVADFLSMGGHSNASALAAAASLAWQYERFGHLHQGGTYRPTKTESRIYVEDHPGLVDSIAFCHRKGVAPVGGHSFMAFIHDTLRRHAGVEAANSLVLALIEGAGLAARDPRLYARNRLINERGRLRSNEKAELIFRSWNGFRRGDTGQKYPILGGALPRLER